MPLFPGHRYLGPGNRLHNGEPVDEDDRIARRHDEAYSRAQSDADVFAADRQHTNEFFKDFVTTGNWHSALGAVSLGTKNLVEEKVLGRSLYGMPPGRKRGNQEQPGPSSAKRQQHDTTDGDEEMSETAADDPSAPPTGGAGIGSNHPNTSEHVQQILRVPRDHIVVTVFNDSKILTTWGVAPGEDSFGVNVMSAIAARAIGVGHEQLVWFCAILGAPKPAHHKTFTAIGKEVHAAAENLAQAR